MFKKINKHNPKTNKGEHWAEIQFLMTKIGTEHAIKLQIENLMLTYGFKAVKNYVTVIDNKIKELEKRWNIWVAKIDTQKNY